jgi:Bacterial Ig domain
MPRPLRFILVTALLAGSFVAHRADAQITAADFNLIARRGFLDVVNGAFPTLNSNTARCSPTATAQDCRRNSYPWSMSFYNGQLYVGTSRDVFCFFSEALQMEVPGTCPAYKVPGQAQRAEVWRYTLAGTGGLSGTWERVFQSPELGVDQPGQAGQLWKCLLLFANEEDPETRKAMTVSCFLTPPANIGSVYMARDTGYRNMTQCETGSPPTNHLFMATTGLPGLVLYWDDVAHTFKRASSAGLRALLNGFQDQPPKDIDIGYRGLTCFQGKLWTAPAASFLTGDTDISDRPVVLMNPDPTSPDEPWLQTNYPGFDNFVDPDHPNLGIFELATYDPDEDGTPDYLVAGTFNRSQGMEVWWTDGTGCDDDLDEDDVQDCVWTQVLDQGAARPASLPTPPFSTSLNAVLGGPAANAAVASMAQFGPNLYLGLSEAAAVVTNTLAELIRIRPDGSWDLIMGAARPVPGGGIGNLPGTINCTPVNLSGQLYCPPVSGLGLGFADAYMGTTAGAGVGFANYVWRMAKYGDELIGGTLDVRRVPAAGAGFDLWKTGGGTLWTRISSNGLGNGYNYGVRGLLTTPAGIFLGGANPFTTATDGGASVYFANLTTAAPIANAGLDRTVFDADGTADLPLDGSSSFDPLGGSVVAWQWYDGDVADSCETLTGPFASGAMTSTSRATGNPYTDYMFTLRVTDDGGLFDCDLVVYRASMNLPPTVEVWTDPPLVPGPLPRLALVDFDNNGSETFFVESECVDPEASLASCLWSLDPGVTFTPPGGLIANVNVLSELALGAGDTSPDLILTGTDTLGFSTALPFDVRVESLVDSPLVNNTPECASGTTWTKVNLQRTINPTAPQRFCIDPDNADSALTYEIISQPDNGEVTLGSLIYTPDTDFVGDDLFTYRAVDPGLVKSQIVALRVRVLECSGLDFEAQLDGATMGEGGVELYQGCYGLSAVNSDIVTAGDVTLEAGFTVSLGNGFTLADGAALTLSIDPTLLEPAP